MVFGLARNDTPYDWLVNYVRQKGISFDILYHANEAVNLYGAFLDPTYVLIDKKGRIRLRKDGFYYSYGSEIDELIIFIQHLIEEP